MSELYKTCYTLDIEVDAMEYGVARGEKHAYPFNMIIEASFMLS